MADISDVDTNTIKDLYEALEGLACMDPSDPCLIAIYTDLPSSSSNHDSDTILSCPMITSAAGDIY